MKRIFAVLLALTLACSALVIVPAADAPNVQFDFEFTQEAPVIDGEIDAGEYGNYAVDSWELADGEGEETFKLANYKITDDPDLAIEFYATWTMDDLYLAWKVTTKYDYRIPATETDDGYMYKYCCVQFIMTPGAPDANVKKYQTGEWTGDYLEIGLCQKDDGNNYKVCWSQPAKVGGGLAINDWEFAGSRDDATNTTVYECRLPWNKTGVDSIGDGAQFGLVWAVGAQENYEDVEQGMVEWVDGIIAGKNADASVCITLTGSEAGITDVTPDVPQLRENCPAGTLPEGMENSLLQIMKVDQAVTAESISFVTDASKVNDYNPNYAQTLLLRPLDGVEDIDGYYEVIENVAGPGAAITFESDVQEGDAALIVHSNSAEDSAGKAARELAESLVAGDKVYIFGLVTAKTGEASFAYNNAQAIVAPNPAKQVIGTWAAEDGTLITFNEDGTGTKGETEMAWEMSEDGVLTIDGTETAWSVADGKLTLAEVVYTAVTEGDYTALNTAITTANLLSADDYTEDSFAALTAALTAANDVVAAKYNSLNQAEIDAAEEALTAAIDALVKVDTGDESSEAASSEATSSATSAATSSAASQPADDDGGISPVVIVIIVVAVIAVIAVVVVVVLKKKK